jgi:bifunctional DNase/RNase
MLREHGGHRALPIFIGEPEGRAMATSLTGMQTPRPMTYQMVASIVAALSGSVTEVRVVCLSENSFIAEMVLQGLSGTRIVDARPSDAINLALLTGAPVRVSADLLEQWAPIYEQVALDAYPDNAQVIRGELQEQRPSWTTPQALKDATVRLPSTLIGGTGQPGPACR